jgi:hypothetical protein
MIFPYDFVVPKQRYCSLVRLRFRALRLNDGQIEQATCFLPGNSFEGDPDDLNDNSVLVDEEIHFPFV